MPHEKDQGDGADISLSIAESGAETALDSLPELSPVLSQAGLTGAAEIVADGIVGAVVPGAFSAVMSYKVRRAERNIVSAINASSKNMDEVNRRLDSLERGQREKFSIGAYRDAFLDSIIEENEPEKVDCEINAFINLMDEDSASDSFVFSLFEDLSRMSRIDIRVLRLYGRYHLQDEGIDDDYAKLTNEENIDDSQYRAIREKLRRFGLPQSKNEEKREENLEELQETVANLIKQLNSKNPRIPKTPKFQRISRSDTYSITSLGIRYLRLMQPVKPLDEK